MQGSGGVGHAEVGWGGSCRGGMGWGGSCRGGVGHAGVWWVMQGGVGHVGVGCGVSCKGGMGWVMQGLGEVNLNMLQGIKSDRAIMDVQGMESLTPKY